jgi:hypothetical protein
MYLHTACLLIFIFEGTLNRSIKGQCLWTFQQKSLSSSSFFFQKSESVEKQKHVCRFVVFFSGTLQVSIAGRQTVIHVKTIMVCKSAVTLTS